MDGEEPMNRYDMYMTTKQGEGLKKLSKETGMNISEIIRRAIDEYLKKEFRLLEKSRQKSSEETKS